MIPSSLLRASAAMLTLAGAAALPLAAATPARDEMALYERSGRLARMALPAGPTGPTAPVAAGIGQLLFLPSGQVLATTLFGDPERTRLNELLPDGSLREIGAIDSPSFAFAQDVAGHLALGSRGRVFAFMESVAEDHPHTPTRSWRAVEIDPSTAASIRSTPIAGAVGAVATAPDGFWSVTRNGQISKLDPETFVANSTGLVIAGMGDILEIATDSAGRIFFLSNHDNCEPRCLTLGSYDPRSGVAAYAPTELYDAIPNFREIAIKPACVESSTAICLQGGRFRAEVAYEAYDGAAGAARVAPARSPDTGIFSFFDPDNWELMVKVLDGCAINSKFWVYSSASTDVGYTMTITDVATGAQKEYSNPLGRIALTVTDNQAFACAL